jgi:hypothetical protein
MAVDIRAAPAFKPGVPRVLFNPHLYGASAGAAFRYDVAPDGQRFLAVTLGQSQAGSPEPITVVLNWEAGSRK